MVQAMRDDSPFYMGMGTVDLGPVANAQAAKTAAEMGLMAQVNTNRTQLDIAKLQSQVDNYRAETEREFQMKGLTDDNILKTKMFEDDSEFRRTAYADRLEMSKRLEATDENHYQDALRMTERYSAFEKEKFFLQMLLYHQGMKMAVESEQGNWKRLDESFRRLEDMIINRRQLKEGNIQKEDGAVNLVLNSPPGAAGTAAADLMGNELRNLGIDATSLDDLGSSPDQVYDRLREKLSAGEISPDDVANVYRMAQKLRDALAQSLKNSGVEKKDMAVVDALVDFEAKSKTQGVELPSPFSLTGPGLTWTALKVALNKVGFDFSDDDLVDLAGGGEGFFKGTRWDPVGRAKMGRAVAAATGKGRSEARGDINRLKAISGEVGPSLKTMNQLNLLVSALNQLQRSSTLPEKSRSALRIGLMEAQGGGMYDIMEGYVNALKNPDHSYNWEGGKQFLLSGALGQYEGGNPYGLDDPALKLMLGNF
jgi:hypothetical protein